MPHYCLDSITTDTITQSSVHVHTFVSVYLSLYMYNNYFIHIYCTDAASVKMNEMKNIEIDRLKEKIQTSTSIMEATGEQFS